MHAARLLVTLILLVTVVPAADAQEAHPPNVLQFDVELETTLPIVQVNEFTDIVWNLKDLSRDDPGTVAGGDAIARAFVHPIRIYSTPLTDDTGWQVQHQSGTQTRAGEERTGSIRITALNTADSPRLVLRLTFEASHTQTDEVVYYNFTINAYSPGLETFAALAGGGYDDLVSPRDVVTAPVLILNQGFLERSFAMEVVGNPCGLEAGLPSGMVVDGKGSAEFGVSMIAPSDKLWYLSQDCTMTVEVWPEDNPDRRMQVGLAMVVNGPYIDPVYFIWAFAIAVAIVVLAAAVARRKAIIEEEILGKPQKPWTIPVEEVYLKHLKERDPRAHYVVRHFLMEEEYSSALMWYKDYKLATKGARAKERLVVGQEHKITRWRAKAARKIAAPIRKADRHEAALQKKLDRQATRTQRKGAKQVRKLVKKMRKAHEARVARENAKWEKAAKKAAKKGRAAPAKPELPEPDYPQPPALDPILLEDHKWNAKAQKFRAKQVRKQGDLEVKYERKEARRLRKVRRKVARIARKLDDPDFVAEHPLLQPAQ